MEISPTLIKSVGGDDKNLKTENNQNNKANLASKRIKVGDKKVKPDDGGKGGGGVGVKKRKAAGSSAKQQKEEKKRNIDLASQLINVGNRGNVSSGNVNEESRGPPPPTEGDMEIEKSKN